MKRSYKSVFLGFVVLYLAIIVYWKDYWKPETFFWDENYHIASAAKYIKGTYFMEPHPPLGKLIIALGELLLKVNDGDTYGFENFDIIPHEKLTPSFSFAGYRFFPSLFSIFNILLFTAILFWITRSYLMSAALSLLPILDTALLLHSRGAMLDSFLLFGELLSILTFFWLLKSPATKTRRITLLSFLMSFAFTFAFMTKIFGLALLVLWPLLYYYKKDSRTLFKKLFPMNFIVVCFLSLSIWAIHIERGKTVQPSLMLYGNYFASDKYERWILGLEKDSWKNFPTKLYENIRYIFHFEKNVSPLNPREKLATGSYPIAWPFGSLPMIYRWQKTESSHMYLYLIPNPWAWLVGLTGLLFALGFWARRGTAFISQNPAFASMTFLYFAFFIPMLFIKRVLYLYHYFPMLFISWILFAFVMQEFLNHENEKRRKAILAGLCLIPLLLFQGFFMYRNFVYYQPIECNALYEKDIIPFWGLQFPSCEIEESKRQFLKQIKGMDP
ncbi:MAG: phospholipid carrier-dependent glycosyltransferase [Bdellovibrionota bacterium]